MVLKLYKLALRRYSTSNRVPQVCIVGAGPAGFYAAMHISKNVGSVNIDMYEKLPVPFGLIRYGVAPDHPEVKNVINQFTKVAQKPNVNFYGNITLGKDITLKELRQHYDAVLLTYGAEEDKTLGIENEDAKNVVAARNFVGWYNGLPSDKNLEVDLSSETAVILGQGNVALDVARILLTPIDELRKTDITQHALEALAESKIKELYLVGRRGPLQVAFTIKELREQLKLKKCRTVWRKTDFVGVSDIVPSLGRPRKRLTELMLKSVNETDDNIISSNEKLFKPIFFRSPTKFLVNDEKQLTGIELVCNKLVGDNIEHQKCIPTNEKEVLNCGLAFRSIGYKSIKVDEDLVFVNGLVANDTGYVTDNSPKGMGKLYVAGWLGTGPVGVILHTMGNAFQVAKNICEDVKKIDLSNTKDGFEEVKRIISKSNDRIITWEQWDKIDKYEIEEGLKIGKPREKICDVDKMIEIRRDTINLNGVEGRPYFSYFKLNSSSNKRNREYTVEYTEETITLKDEIDIKISGNDNRNILDDGHSQKLSAADIEILKSDANKASDIVETLITNSNTFHNKTEFSQEKYLKKKEKKYFEYIQIMKPTLRIIAEIMYKLEPAKIHHLRIDTLSQIITMSNIQCDGVHLLYDSGSNGLLAAALLSTIGENTEGKLLHMHPGNMSQKQALLALNFEEEQLKRCVSVNVYSALRQFYQGNDTNLNKEKNHSENPHKRKIEEDTEAHNKVAKLEDSNISSKDERNSDKIKTATDVNSESNNINSVAVTKVSSLPEPKKPKWHFDNITAAELLKNKVDSLVIACKEDPQNIFKELVNFVKPGRPFVVYYPVIEPLQNMFLYLKPQSTVSALKLTYNWLRNYQVLPERTHPEVMMNGSSGYILSGYILK